MKKWEDTGVCHRGEINMDAADAYSDIIYLINGTLKHGKRYRITIEEIDDNACPSCGNS